MPAWTLYYKSILVSSSCSRISKPVWFFTSYDEAYSWAIDHFGLSDIFLVSEVKKRSDESVSISWQAGVLVSDI